MRMVLPLLALLPFPSRPTAAQETVTLAEAVRLAREFNADYRKALNDRDASGVEARSGRLWFLPTVNASLSFSGSSATNVTGQDDFGLPLELPSPVSFQSSSASQSIGAQMTLFDGFRGIRGSRAAAANRDAANASAAGTAIRIEAQVARQFYTALRQRALIDVEQQLLASARDQQNATERLFRTAGADQVDVLGAQVQVAQQEQALAQQEGEAEKAGLELARLLGLDEIRALVPLGEAPELFDPSAIPLEALITRAVRESPQVARLDAAATAANANAGAAAGSRWPTIQASASFGRSISLRSYEAFGELNPRNRSFGFGVSFSLPVFTRFQTSANIARARAQARNADEDLRAGRLQVEANVRTAYVDILNTYRASVLADRSAELSRTRRDLAQEQYRLGATTYQNLQQVIDRAAQAERQAVAARFNFALALVALEEVVGGALRP